MKHLQKFNEGKKKDTIAYLEMCFIDFYDKGYRFKKVKNDDDSEDLYSMTIELGIKHNSWVPNNTDYYIKLGENIKYYAEESKYIFDKIYIDYPNAECSVVLNKGYIFLIVVSFPKNNL